MPNFTYLPSYGTGNTQVSVSTASNNLGQTNRVSTLIFDNGTNYKSVTLTQLHQPYFTLNGSTSVPASGGTMYFTVTTDYDFFFYNIPGWIQVKKGNTTYTNMQRISKSEAGSGNLFSLVIDANTGSSRSSGQFMMGWYIGQVEQNECQYFNLTQAAQGVYTVVSTTVDVRLGNSPNGTFYVDVVIYSEDSNMSSTSFTLTQASTFATANMDVKLLNGAASIEVEVTVTRSGGTGQGLPWTEKVSLDYGPDSLYEEGDLGDALTFNTQYYVDETIDINVDVDTSL